MTMHSTLRSHIDQVALLEDLVNSRDALYESFSPAVRNHALLWESVGKSLLETQLSAEQIASLFKNIETDATALGKNRTGVGKAKDAWADLKNKIYNSKPMQGFANVYDAAAGQLGKEMPGAMPYINKYRKFATEHPIMQGAVYALLIAATGLSGAGLVGAAGLGLFKLFDQLIQGKDIRSAMYSAAKTGGTAAAIGGLKSFMQHAPTDTGGVNNGVKIRASKDIGYIPGVDDVEANKTPVNPNNSGLNRAPAQTGVSKGMGVNPNTVDGGDVSDTSIKGQQAQQASTVRTMNNFADKMGLTGANHTAKFVGGLPVEIDGQPVPKDMYTPDQLKRINAAKSMAAQMGQDAAPATKPTAPKVRTGANSNPQNFEEAAIMLEAAQIATLFKNIQYLDEGIWDTVKKGASAVATGAKAVAGSRIGQAVSDTAKDAIGKVADYAKTKGANITNTITADKLMTAWKKDGSKTDTKDIERILLAQKVDPKIIATVFKKMKIPTGKGTSTPASVTTPAANPAAAATANPAASQASSSTAKPRVRVKAGSAPASAPAAKPTAAPAAAPASATSGSAAVVSQIKKIQQSPQGQEQIKAAVNKLLANPPAPTVTESMRGYIDLMNIQKQLVNEAMPFGLGKRLGTAVSALNPFTSADKRATAQGQAVAQRQANRYFVDLSKRMGQQGLTWETITWNTLAKYLSQPGGIKTTPSELKKIADALPATFRIGPVDFKAQTAIASRIGAEQAEKIGHAVIQSAITAYYSRSAAGEPRKRTAPLSADQLVQQLLKLWKAEGLNTDEINKKLADLIAPPPTPPPPTPVPENKIQIPVNSTVILPEGTFVKTTIGWISEKSGRPVVARSAEALDVKVMKKLQRKAMGESLKPARINFVTATKKKV